MLRHSNTAHLHHKSMTIISDATRLNRIKAGLGLAVAADNSISGQWLNSSDQVLVTWGSLTRSFNESTDVATFTGGAVNPTTAGTVAKQRILFSGVAALEDVGVTLTDGSNAVTSVSVTDDCTLSHESSHVVPGADLVISDACRKRLQKAMTGLGSSAIGGMSCRLWSGSAALVEWSSFSTVDGVGSVALSTGQTAAIADGTPTRFQVMNGGSVELDFSMTVATISDGSSNITSIVTGNFYRVNVATFSIPSS